MSACKECRDTGVVNVRGRGHVGGWIKRLCACKATPAMRIDRFQGQHRFLSNFYAARVVYEDIIYPTSEHAFQAAKTLRRDLRLEIAGAPTPYIAKRLGRTLALRPAWDRIRNDVMLAILRIKFASPTLKRLLLETGDAQLVEGNDHGDTYWGVCRDHGENWLGRLLMVVRAELM